MDLKGDMGRKAKALRALIVNCVTMFGNYGVGMLVTNHVYASQDMFDPSPKISGGASVGYASSIVVVIQKRKLKEDGDGNKTSEVFGIRSAIECVKTRYNKPFQKMEIQIPYDKGMNPYSGLVDMFEKTGLLVKDGNKLKYTYLDGTEDKWFRKQITDEILDKIMLEFPTWMERKNKKEEQQLEESNFE